MKKVQKAEITVSNGITEAFKKQIPSLNGQDPIYNQSITGNRLQTGN